MVSFSIEGYGSFRRIFRVLNILRLLVINKTTVKHYFREDIYSSIPPQLSLIRSFIWFTVTMRGDSLSSTLFTMFPLHVP